MPRIISMESLKAERRDASFLHPIEEQLPLRIGRQNLWVPYRVVNGEVEAFEYGKPLGELMQKQDDIYTYFYKQIVDLRIGRERVPTLYEPIYTNHTDPNFTEFIDTMPYFRGNLVFVDRMELEEVHLGSRTRGVKQTIPLVMYSTGWQVTREMIIYDRTWEVAQMVTAMGEAYNALLNHMHFSPITTFTYAAKNQTPADTTTGTTRREHTRATIRAAIIHAAQDIQTDTLYPRGGSILLIHPSRRFDIEDALGEFQVGGTIWPRLTGIDTIIEYRGFSIQVGEKLYTYPGVDTGKAYLIDPKRYFHEFVKQDLLVETGEGDLSRLIEAMTVATCIRGLLASPANAVEELTLPA